MEENSLRYIISSSLLSGVSVGCICSAIETGNLALSITAGVCSALGVFSYMYSQHKQKSDYIALIKQEIEKNTEIASSVNDFKAEYTSEVENIIKKISEYTESLSNLNNEYNKLITRVAENVTSQLERNSKSQVDILTEISKKIESVNLVQSELNSMLKIINNETLTNIISKQNSIKTALDSIDSNISDINTNVKNIYDEIMPLNVTFSDITNGMSENNDKMSDLSKGIREFNDNYQTLLNKMTSEQKRMLDLQRENCNLLRNIGDRFRGDLKR